MSDSKTPSSLEIAEKGIQTIDDYTQLMSAIQADVNDQTITPGVGEEVTELSDILRNVIGSALKSGHGVDVEQAKKVTDKIVQVLKDCVVKDDDE